MKNVMRPDPCLVTDSLFQTMGKRNSCCCGLLTLDFEASKILGTWAVLSTPRLE